MTTEALYIFAKLEQCTVYYNKAGLSPDVIFLLN